MRLADDPRGRIPFAIVGIVLLVGSATYVATVSHRERTDPRPDAVDARERLEAAVDTAVREATVRAAARAGQRPVVDPAETPAGRAIDDDRPFRSYLELRISVAVRRALDDLVVESGSVTATASLPEPRNLSAASETVDVTRGTPNASLTVRLENVTYVVRRGGRAVLRDRRTIERTVSSPVLALHDRVSRYERLLNAGLANTSGLAARIAATLYPLAWGRGYAQYAGVPVENVVANRHLAVAANLAMLAVQRDTFGRSDPAGEAALRKAVALMAAQDIGKVTEHQLSSYLRRTLSTRRNRSVPIGSLPSFPTGPPDVPSRRSDVRVGVDQSADRALAAVLNGSAEPGLSAVLRRTYSVEVGRRAAVRVLRSQPKPRPEPPKPGWRLVGSSISRTASASGGSAPVPPRRRGWHRLASFTRQVRVTKTITWTWTNGNETTATSASWRTVKAVGVALEARHGPTELAPRRGIETVHQRGEGPLDGPNLAGVAERVERRYLQRPGESALAEAAALGRLDTSPGSVYGARPDGLRAHVRPALQSLRRRVRNISTRVPRGDVGTGAVNPAAQLVAELQARREQFVDAPETYDSVAQKATVAARAAYLDAVVERLQRRQRITRRRNEGLGSVISEFGLSLSDLRAAMAADPAAPRGGKPLFADGLDGRVEVTVAGTPPYLSRAAVTRKDTRAVGPSTDFHALRTRNVNLFTLPSGDAADVVVDAVGGESGTTSLRTAANTLEATNETLARTADPTLRAKRDELQTAVATAVRRLQRRGRAVLRAVDRRLAGGNLDEDDRRTAIRAAADEWDTTAARALALANGSFARVLAHEVESRADLPPGGRGLVAMHLESAFHRGIRSDRIRPPRSLVNETGSIARGLLQSSVGHASEAAFNRSFEALQRRYGGRYKLVPAGLPITPVPAYYYAVANVWINQIRGRYAAFTVAARSGAAAGPTTVSYRRDGSPVRFDVDGDGDRELLGWADRVSFAVTVPVVVVVPPTPNGIGDRDGNADERSSGWDSPPPIRHNRTGE